MQLADLLTHPAVDDIITTDRTLFLLVRDTPPPLYSDKEIVIIQTPAVLAHPRLAEILTGTSLRHGTFSAEPIILYTYRLDQHPLTQKQRFAHQLYGTTRTEGTLAALQGTRIGRAAFTIPPAQETAMDAFLATHEVHAKKRRGILEARE